MERPITLSSSLVAVCCSRATRSSPLRASSSVKRRTFSMAITAWSANVRSNPISASVNGRTSWRKTTMAPTGRSSRSIGTLSAVWYPVVRARAWLAGNRGSRCMSSTWMTTRSSIAPPAIRSLVSGCGNSRAAVSRHSGGLTVLRDQVNLSPSSRFALP